MFLDLSKQMQLLIRETSAPTLVKTGLKVDFLCIVSVTSSVSLAQAFGGGTCPRKNTVPELLASVLRRYLATRLQLEKCKHLGGWCWHSLRNHF